MFRGVSRADPFAAVRTRQRPILALGLVYLHEPPLSHEAAETRGVFGVFATARDDLQLARGLVVATQIETILRGNI